MPDYISRKWFNKKVIDRWENEGGRISADAEDSFGDDLIGEQKNKRLSAAKSISVLGENFRSEQLSQ